MDDKRELLASELRLLKQKTDGLAELSRLEEELLASEPRQSFVETVQNRVIAARHYRRLLR